ncbi:MAG TPA: protein-glutamate O-methyltransferase CheR [Vicinamibacterales bacterium]|jgi:chemotaxis protein methyltransferase CheR
MSTHSDNLGLSMAAMPLLRDLVHERTGLYFAADRFDMLADRLAPLVLERGFDSFLDYYYLLKYDACANVEWAKLIDALVVGETYFWREADQIQAVVSEVVPSLVRARPADPVRLWVVPCATGEEPLTIAMMLDHAGWFERARFEIHASDASQAAIERAKTGRYRERAFRSLPPELRDRYFRQDRDAWVVDPRLHRRVTSWSVVNLMDNEMPFPAQVPIVFCRNVFIYFSEPGVRRVVERFATAMSTPGYLCVGASESLLKVTTRFELQEIAGAFVYVKQ